tara:strand:+ start:48 stop:683 length:636 start_codon:yes stop_codon:yes gene_type:complete
MQINLGTSLSGLRQAIATSSVPDDHSATHPDSFTGTDYVISSKLFSFTDIPLGYLESITVTFTISGETDSGTNQFTAPVIGFVRITEPTFFQTYTQNSPMETMENQGGGTIWFENFTSTVGQKSFVINASTHNDPSNPSHNNPFFDNIGLTSTITNKRYNLADQRHTQDSFYASTGFQFEFRYSDSDEDAFSPTISNVTIDVVYKEAPYEN